MKKRNGSILLTIIAWLLSAIIIPSMPEWMKGRSLFSYPFMEYGPTIGMFAVILLVVWIPVGIKASKIYESDGIRRSIWIITVTFVIQIIVWILIFTFLWNS